MQVEAQTIQSAATLSAATEAMPKQDLEASAARWVPIATGLLTIIAVLLASGLAVVMNLS